ncbi:MAG: branched-chain-amino-acid transaminase [Armatimonadetes bacterium]|nr:branched-chain-amino-acid transaminase [Armatimonadota bacterium]
MAVQVYLDGKYVDKDEAKISVWDHGLLYGDGVFEGIRAYNGRVFRLDEHLRRLYDSLKSVHIKIPLSRAEMKKAVLQTLRLNAIRDGYVRLIITRGKGDLGIDPRKCSKATIIIMADKIQLYPQEYYEKGLKLTFASTRRNISEALNPRIKSLNYLNNIMAKIEAIEAGYQEAIMLNAQGFVCECTTENIFLIRDGILTTPPVWAGALEGVTRNTVIELARKEGIPIREELFTGHDIYIADECFITGTGAEILPVIEVCGRTIGEGVPGPSTRRLLAAYRDITTREGTPIHEKESLTV